MEDDKDLFKRAVQGVTPLKDSTFHLFNEKNHHKQINNKQNDVKPQINFDNSIISENIRSSQHLSFKQSGFSDKTFKMLKQGKIPIKAKIDLHGLIVNEAKHKLSSFLQSCFQRKIRCVLIIHGKGNNSENHQPILKANVNAWLKQLDFILAFSSAHIKDGGTGSLYVYLKKSL